METRGLSIDQLLDEYESAVGSYGRTGAGMFFSRILECRTEVRRRLGRAQLADMPPIEHGPADLAPVDLPPLSTTEDQECQSR